MTLWRPDPSSCAGEERRGKGTNCTRSSRNGATPRGFTSWTPNPTLGSRRSSGSSSRKSLPRGPVTRDRVRSIADPRASMVPRWARRPAMARAGFSPWTPTASTCWASGKWTAARRPSPMTSLGTWATTPWSPASGARPTWSATASTPTSSSKAVTATQLHVWDLRKRRHVQAIDLGAEQQMVLDLRPAHDPTKAYGFAGGVVSLKDLSASIWVWHQDNGKWAARKVIEIPAEPADPDQLPPLLQGFKAVPPLITDINLSVDDRFLSLLSG